MAQTRPWTTRECEYLCITGESSFISWLPHLTRRLMLVQVHKLEGSKWKEVTVVPINIADRSSVSVAVSKSPTACPNNSPLAPPCGQTTSTAMYLPIPFHLHTYYYIMHIITCTRLLFNWIFVKKPQQYITLTLALRIHFLTDRITCDMVTNSHSATIKLYNSIDNRFADIGNRRNAIWCLFSSMC